MCSLRLPLRLLFSAGPLLSREPLLSFVILSSISRAILFKGWSFAAKLSFYSSCSREGRSQSSSFSLSSLTISFFILRYLRLIIIATGPDISQSQNLPRIPSSSRP